MSQQPHVLFVPDWRKDNPYQSLLAEAVGGKGFDVRFSGLGSGPFSLQALLKDFPNTDVVHLHWIDDLVRPLLWSQLAIKRELRLWLLWADIVLLRMRGIKVVWTIHNAVSHESSNPVFEKRIRGVVAKVVNRVILHSESALRFVENEYQVPLHQKASIVPHGSYIGRYALTEQPHHLDSLLGDSNERLVLLFFGAVRRYKGVTGLIESFRRTKRPDLRLVIAGACSEPELKKEITAAARHDPRIFTATDYIPDAEVADLFRLSDVVVLPFETILTSGSAVLAMSLAKALLMPETAKILEIGDEKGTLYFPGDEALPEFLDSLNKQQLGDMGIHNRWLMGPRSWDNVADMTVGAYQSAKSRFASRR